MKENDQHIDELLIGYLLNEINEEERHMVENWLHDSPANQIYFEQFKKIWEESLSLAKDHTSDEQAAWRRFQVRINEPKEARKTVSFRWMRIAAILLLVIGGSVIAYLGFHSNKPLKQLEVVALTKVLKDTLPDGSVITLNRNSRISFPEKFTGALRQVSLKGEAFFNVSPNKQKPFLIHVNDVTIRVVGTSFNVRSEGETTEVIVETGIVQVTKKGKTVELKPKDRLLVREQDSVLAPEREPDKLYTYYRTGVFTCDNTPLWKLVTVLNEAYDADIVIARKELRNLQLTTTFNDESLDRILEIVSMTFNIKIDRSGGKIILR